MPVVAKNEDTKPASGTALTEVATRLTQLRNRNTDQLTAQRHAKRRVDREAERRVKTALKAYATAEVAIRAVERGRDDKAASLVQQIKRTREAAQVKIEQLRQQQVMAMWQLSDAGRTAEQIAELLELPLTETHRLLGAGHTTVPSDAATTADHEPHTD
jgi:nuclear transport factor 2 (NTF2) superfamily protein